MWGFPRPTKTAFANVPNNANVEYVANIAYVANDSPRSVLERKCI